jgi:hypothetical protein
MLVLLFDAHLIELACLQRVLNPFYCEKLKDVASNDLIKFSHDLSTCSIREFVGHWACLTDQPKEVNIILHVKHFLIGILISFWCP